MDETIYLDHNASTPCDPRVVEAMLPFYSETYANASSLSHRPGQAAAAALQDARRRIARAIGARTPAEVVFTAGATEADNLAIRGLAAAGPGRRRHMVSQRTEHPAVLQPMALLERSGWEITLVGVDRGGRVRLDELAAAVRPDTALVALMLVNNETGTIQPVAEAARIAHDAGALILCDGAQGVGKVPVDVNALDVDLFSLSGHKFYAPKGVGALYLRRRRPPTTLAPLFLGGGHEHGLRSGTPNLPGIAGLARALDIVADELPDESRRLAALRDRLEHRLTGELDGVTVNGDIGHRVPNTSNLSFAGVDGNALLASLPDLAVSSGSACSSAHPEPSPVLTAMGVPRDLASASLRLSVGRFTTEAEADRAAVRIIDEVRRLRGMR